MNYDMQDIIKHYQKTTGASEQKAKKAEKGFKEFFVMIADVIHKKNNYTKAENFENSDGLAPLRMPCGECDKIWHAFLLHTKQYRSFCNETIGSFIEHMPLSTTELQEIDFSAEQKSLELLYEENFGTKPPTDMWDRFKKDKSFIARLKLWWKGSVVIDGELC